MDALRSRWKKLSPRTRQVLGAGVLVGGVIVVGGQLKGTTPRDVEVHVPLEALIRAGFRPLAVEVTLSRGTIVLRSLDRRYGTASPSELVETLPLPEGALRAHVAVTLDDQVVIRDETVDVRAGEPLRIPPPLPPAVADPHQR